MRKQAGETRGFLNGVVSGWKGATYGGLTAEDVLKVMQHWETRPASEEQTAISVKLGQLRALLVRREECAK